MNNKKLSPRQELDAWVGTGNLRDHAEKARLSPEAIELLVTVVSRYCQPRYKRRSKP